MMSLWLLIALFYKPTHVDHMEKCLHEETTATILYSFEVLT